MRHTDRPSFRGVHVETACVLDCPDSCSLVVTLRDGRIVGIDGSSVQNTTRGFICAKVRRYAERVYGHHRLLSPAVRSGPKGSGRFTSIEWDEALDRLAGVIDSTRNRYGGEAILPISYGGSNGLLSQDTADARLFRRLGTSRLARTVCAAPTGAALSALYGKMPSVAYEDYVHARLIVVWGANPSTSGIHLVPIIREAQRGGAALVVIDPRWTPLARLATLHLPVRPGADVAIALALHRFLFEEGGAATTFLDQHAHHADRLRERARPWTFERAAEVSGVDAAAIERFARLYTDSSPAVIRCGWGLERNRNGGNAALAVLALPAVAGKFGVRGGGYTMSSSGAWRLQDAWLSAEEPATRLVNMNRLGRALTELRQPPVKVLFVYNCNPVATLPDQNRLIAALNREDLFTVVFDQVATDTARWADLLLPATTFLEAHDIAKAYGPLSLQLVNPVIEPQGDARPNADVFAGLTRRLGLDRKGEADDELTLLMERAKALPEAVRTSLWERRIAHPPCGPAPVQFVDVVPGTEDGKVDLFPEPLDLESGGRLYSFRDVDTTDAYPLTLISPASDRTICSTLGERSRPEVHLMMNVEDARERDIEEDDTVRVTNELGEVRCRVAIGQAVRPGVVSLPKGIWQKDTLNGSTATALVPDSLTDFAGGACFNDARVEVVRVPD